MTLEELTRLLNQQSSQGFSGQSAPIGYDQIISAIQSQYQPTSFAPVSEQYGAGRFITNREFSQPSVVEYGRQLQNQVPSYVPQDFAEQQAALKVQDKVSAPNESVSTGSSNRYSDFTDSAAGQSGLEALKSASQANIISGLLNILGIPGMLMRPVIGAAEAKAANNVMDVLSAYGGTPTEKASQLAGAIQSIIPFGLLGKQDAVVAAKALGNAFENNTQLMSGYLDAATNPDIGRIVDSLAANAETGLTPAQYGAIGASVGQYIHSAISNGMNYSDAVTSVANNLGVNTIGNYGAGSTYLTNPVAYQSIDSSSDSDSSYSGYSPSYSYSSYSDSGSSGD